MPNPAASVEALDHLLAMDAIRQVKARYCRCIDTKQWDRLASLFTADCLFEGLGSAPAGADVATFVAGVSRRLAPTISVHHVHSLEFVRTGPDDARAIWAMEDYVEWQDGGAVAEMPGSKGFRGYGHYEEAYRREDGEWKISFLRLTRLRLDPCPRDAPAARMGALRAAPDWLETGR